MLIQHQEALDRIVSNWTQWYVADGREHQELVEPSNDTRALWPEYWEEQITLIERQGNAKLGDSMHRSLVDDTKAYDRWRQQASDVEMRSAQALSKIEDMNTFILFYKNQSDCKAITEYDDLESPGRRDFSWRAWAPLKWRPPASPRLCRAAEPSPNATTQTRNEIPGPTGSGHEITSE